MPADPIAPTASPSVEGLRTADLVDALGRFHRHRCTLGDLVSPNPRRALFGPAVTISYFPACSTRLPAPQFSFARLFYEAIADGAEGKVLVLAAQGHRDVSLGGGTKLSRVDNHGMAGILTDGRLRDFAELSRFRGAIWCRGEATRWGGDVLTPFEANRPVVVEGVGIFPGDYVFADASGAVVIPAAILAEVIAQAHRIVAADAGFVDQIRTEDPATVLGEER